MSTCANTTHIGPPCGPDCMFWYQKTEQCEACEQMSPVHNEYGLCRSCVQERGWNEATP